MKVLIIGGHLTPALAVIKALPQGTDVIYAGRTHALEGDSALSLEYQTITSLHIPFISITTGRLQRKWSKHTLPSLVKLPQGFMQAFLLLKTYKPDIIVGFGSYLSVPIGIVGYLLHIPLIIHEQTLQRGVANKILTPFAAKICVSWKQSLTCFPQKKSILTGNPAISQIFENSIKHAKKTKQIPTILIVGGSLGSHAINILVEACLEKLLTRYFLVHQTGDAKEFNDFQRLTQKKQSLPAQLQKNYSLIKFISPEKIIETFQNADLVITRAGINTIVTLILLEKPSLVIPLPTSQNNEQGKNALLLQSYGLGNATDQTDLTPEKFLSIISDMVKNLSRYKNTKGQEDMQIHKEATQKIIACILSTYAEKSHLKKKN